MASERSIAYISQFMMFVCPGNGRAAARRAKLGKRFRVIVPSIYREKRALADLENALVM
jgi:hypothetical protein